MKQIALLLCVAVATSLEAGTTRNNDSCDISVMPAATMLLPYFEVDIVSPAETAQTTLFTIINTSPIPQIAHVTLWSDWAYPVLDFPLYLTGYDAQAINLRDVLVDGSIAATSSGASVGQRSVGSNPNFLADAATSCVRPPAQIPTAILSDVRAALTNGTFAACGTARIGGAHRNAVGYATVDVVATCSAHRITDARGFDELLYDNVLTGDWQIVQPDKTSGNHAAGNPLVHIRAVPEGGPAAAATDSNLPYTFYDRFAGPGRRLADRRQPLPSSFAVRFIQGGNSGFLTDFLLWREGVGDASASCSDHLRNRVITLSGMVRFDERENPTTAVPGATSGPGPFDFSATLPATSRRASTNSLFPFLTSGDIAGWMAFNLDNGGSAAYGVTPPGRNFRSAPTSTVVGPRPSQNWVVPLLFAEGRYAAAFEAIVLANGCSPAPEKPALGMFDIGLVGPGPNPTP